jgi:hypothetical protein
VGLYEYLEVNIYSVLYIMQWNVLNKFWCLNKKEGEFLHFVFVFTLQLVLKKDGNDQVVFLANSVTKIHVCM